MTHIQLNELALFLQDYKRCAIDANGNRKQWYKLQIEGMLKSAPLPIEIRNGLKLDFDRSTTRQLIFSFQYYHSGGQFFSDHKLIIQACLAEGYTLDIKGKKYGDVKAKLHKHFVILFKYI